MSFELIAYEVLKPNLKMKIKELIQDHKPGRLIDVDRLDESLILLQEGKSERYQQTLFLFHIIKLCDKASPEINKAMILNTAVYVVLQQIAQSYKRVWIGSAEQRSSFYIKLQELLNLSANNTPSSHEALRMYQSLKMFLLDYGKNAHLDVFSWLLRQIKQGEISLLETTQQLRLHTPHKLQTEPLIINNVAKSDGKAFSLVDTDHIKRAILQSITNLIKHHVPHCIVNVDADALIKCIPLLVDQNRVAQCLFLFHVVQSVSTVTDDDVAKKILNAAAYFVREKIAASYGYISPDNSKLYQLLSISLSLQESMPSSTQLFAMYSALKDFLYAQCYNNKDPVDGAINASPFFTIPCCNIEDDLAKLISTITALELLECKQKLPVREDHRSLLVLSMLSSPLPVSPSSEPSSSKSPSNGS